MNLIKKTIVKVQLCVFWQASNSTERSWFCLVLGNEQRCTQRALTSSRYLFRTWADFQVPVFTGNSSLLVPLGWCNKCQTREGGKGVRIFLPAGKQALQKLCGETSQPLQRHSPCTCSAHLLERDFCLAETESLSPWEGQQGLKGSLRAACAQKVWIWQVSFTQSFRNNLYNENVLFFSYLSDPLSGDHKALC